MTVILLSIAAGNHSSTDGQSTTQTTSAPVESEEDRAARAAEERMRDIQRSPEKYLELTEAHGVKAGFETVFMLSGRIQNPTEIDIKDPRISCDLFGESGTRIGDVTETLLQIIPAGGEHNSPS